jgi:hypothetical protein|nr:hypothetical protein [Burkholderia sp. 4M9327F10]
MIKVSILNPYREEDGYFDTDDYCNRHMPLAARRIKEPPQRADAASRNTHANAASLA